MKPLFADTFYWIAVTDWRESSHAAALALTTERQAAGLVTTDEVLTEFFAFFSNAPEPMRRWVAKTARDAISSRDVRVIPQSRESFLSGLDLYTARPDKGYSLVDCISMQTMRRLGLTEVLTNDRHFVREGFTALLRRE